MFHLKQELYRITDHLNDAGLDYALCGGLAVAVHGYPRGTKDIDLLVLESQAEAIREVLIDCGYLLESAAMRFDSDRETERTMVRVSQAFGTDLLIVDLLLVAPFLEDVWKTRESHTVDGHTIQVVSRNGLAKMKLAAGRSHDLVDLERLGLAGEAD